jgi:hypothetical protein
LPSSSQTLSLPWPRVSLRSDCSGRSPRRDPDLSKTSFLPDGSKPQRRMARHTFTTLRAPRNGSVRLSLQMLLLRLRTRPKTIYSSCKSSAVLLQMARLRGRLHPTPAHWVVGRRCHRASQARRQHSTRKRRPPTTPLGRPTSDSRR